MKLRHQRSRLEFGQIADEWAAEDGSPNPHKHLHELVARTWLRDFEDDAGRSCLFLNVPGGKAIRFNRRSLLTAMKGLTGYSDIAERNDRSVYLNMNNQHHLAALRRLQKAVGSNIEASHQSVVLKQAKEWRLATLREPRATQLLRGSRHSQPVEKCFHSVVDVAAMSSQQTWRCRSQEENVKFRSSVYFLTNQRRKGDMPDGLNYRDFRGLYFGP